MTGDAFPGGGWKVDGLALPDFLFQYEVAPKTHCLGGGFQIEWEVGGMGIMAIGATAGSDWFMYVF